VLDMIGGSTVSRINHQQDMKFFTIDTFFVS